MNSNINYKQQARILLQAMSATNQEAIPIYMSDPQIYQNGVLFGQENIPHNYDGIVIGDQAPAQVIITPMKFSDDYELTFATAQDNILCMYLSRDTAIEFISWALERQVKLYDVDEQEITADVNSWAEIILGVTEHIFVAEEGDPYNDFSPTIYFNDPRVYQKGLLFENSNLPHTFAGVAKVGHQSTQVLITPHEVKETYNISLESDNCQEEVSLTVDRQTVLQCISWALIRQIPMYDADQMFLVKY